VEHRLPNKSGFRPFKQRPRSFSRTYSQGSSTKVTGSNIVSVEKESGKLRVCIDFYNLNRATPKDEYPMHVADMLINNASENRVFSFLAGNAGYNQIFMAEEDASKTTFICLGFIGLFE
jgi:hypothetical protein